VALVLVLGLIVIMTIFTMLFFVSVTDDSSATKYQSQAIHSQQLATSAAQMVMAQIQAAANRSQSGAGNANNAVAWTSQPGLIRTYTTSGASTVYKLYSAKTMVSDTFSETEDSPSLDWKSLPDLFCDINAPALLTSGDLVYPVADPAAAGVVPGFKLDIAPGYSNMDSASPENNPLPMPVRWLYILKDGQIATPESIGGDGSVVFTVSGPQPSEINPVVGRVAFWTDDETCKVNINTAGYAKNDSNYWSYWDTPSTETQDESDYLSSAQPWTNEFLRYPGHPATTGLNIVFDDLNLTAEQVAKLTPRYVRGGTDGGTVRVTTSPSKTDTDALLKNQRLYPTTDEFFYDPVRAIANPIGTTPSDFEKSIERRRFLLTSVSRAPETTLFDTPRITVWPTWKTASKRTPLDRLIAFCSTIAPDSSNPQHFYFMREDPLSTRELLDIQSNISLYNYLQELTRRKLPGVGGNFESKYDPPKNRDQILTSIFDAIRLSNLDDRSGPGAGETTGYSYTAGALKKNASTGKWEPTVSSFNVGYAAPPDGPNGTRGAGRASTLAEVAILFARPSDSTAVDASGVRESDKVKATMLYGFVTPSAGMVMPGQNRRIEVDGLDQFKVTVGANPPIQLFPGLTHWTNTQIDSAFKTSSYTTGYFRRGFGDGFMGMGGVDWTMSAQHTNPANGQLEGFVPPTADLILPYDTTNTSSSNINTFTISDAVLTISVFSPANSATPLQTYRVKFPQKQVLTPMPTTSSRVAWTLGGRWDNYGSQTDISDNGDTVVAMQNRTGDYRSEILRTSDSIIDDFLPHGRFGKTDILPLSMAGTPNTANVFSRRASSLKYLNGSLTLPTPGLKSTVFGNLVEGFNNYRAIDLPALPGHISGSVQANFPPGDFANGPGSAPDGSWSPKSDEGKSIDLIVGGTVTTPYFRSTNAPNEGAEGTISSPNRQMPSAIFLGLVPTGVYSSPSVPWRTLLFRPGWSLVGGGEHFGATSPPDWFLLDFFCMPVVEPYAISEPLSTAGKINMNSRIMPFSAYLTRDTGLYAVLSSTRLTAIPDSVHTAVGAPPKVTTRYQIDVDETMGSFYARYNGGDGTTFHSFLTNGEICGIDLVPKGFSRSALPAFWADKRTTGDNLREAPYASLLPRLTTKSNSFTVHVTAQAVASGLGVVGWKQGRSKVLSEWRGAITIERYVDPNDERFAAEKAPDFLTGIQSLGPYYRFRVLGVRRFDP